jgi:hypothetical protein
MTRPERLVRDQILDAEHAEHLEAFGTAGAGLRAEQDERWPDGGPVHHSRLLRLRGEQGCDRGAFTAVDEAASAAIALGRVGEADDIGATVAAILSEGFGWANGARIELSRGQTL